MWSFGSTVTFTYVVTNAGNDPLANVALTDDKLGPITSFTGDTNGNGLLDLNETWTYTETATALPGQQTNVGTVTAQDKNNTSITVTDHNPANYFGGITATWSQSPASGTSSRSCPRMAPISRRRAITTAAQTFSSSSRSPWNSKAEAFVR